MADDVNRQHNALQALKRARADRELAEKRWSDAIEEARKAGASPERIVEKATSDPDEMIRLRERLLRS